MLWLCHQSSRSLSHSLSQATFSVWNYCSVSLSVCSAQCLKILLFFPRILVSPFSKSTIANTHFPQLVNPCPLLFLIWCHYWIFHSGSIWNQIGASLLFHFQLYLCVLYPHPLLLSKHYTFVLLIFSFVFLNRLLLY